MNSKFCIMAAALSALSNGNFTNVTMTHKVFVYGTLKRNQPNYHWLTNPENGKGAFLSEAVTKKKYPLIIATKYNIPFLLQSPGNGAFVKGEVFEVDDLMLSKLDILEGHPDYYVREEDDIILNSNSGRTEAKCWVYFLKHFKKELLDRPQFDDYSSQGPHGLPYTERTDDYHSTDTVRDFVRQLKNYKIKSH